MDPKKNKENKNENNPKTHDTLAWKGTWDRPLKLDENSLDPFTVARMTDHNVRGSDEEDEEEIYPDEDRKLEDDDIKDEAA